jgi:hypothetical protein
MTPEEYLAGDAKATALYEAVQEALEHLGGTKVQASKSQIAFRRRHAFAAVWIPSRYLKGTTAPLVLTIFLRRRLESPRWKSIVEPAPGRFTHHLELFEASEVDEEVRSWLREAWEGA